MNQKIKYLHSIVIEGCNISTQLQYNLNTNHIGVGTTYRNLKQYQKEYYENNKEKINKQRKQYYQNHKDESKQYRKDNKNKISKQMKKYREDNKNKIKQYYENIRNSNTNRKGSLDDRIKRSCITQGININDFNGFTNNSYCPKFNDTCREQNRNKYNRKCYLCGKNENQNGKRLSVHHIDMNKQQGCDDIKWKLVPLCNVCHNKVHNDLWKNRLEYLVNLNGN